MSQPLESERRLRFVLAAVPGPVSVETLADSQLWRMTELWALLDGARESGIVVADPKQPGFFRWAAADRRAAALAEATRDDLAALLERAPFPELFLAGARAAAHAHDFASAGQLYRALIATPRRELLPNGDADWIAAMKESLRMFRSTWGVSPELLEEAIALAVSEGDLASQAVLLAARGLQLLGYDPIRAQELSARALEAAEALADPVIANEAHVYQAISLIFLGHLQAGIAACEEMLGDVPTDPFDAHAPPYLLELDSPNPGSALAVLSFGYVNAGDYPRALDLLHRMAGFGARIGNAALEAEANLFLAVTYLRAGNSAAAAPHAEGAWAFWSTPGLDPLHGWVAAAQLGTVRGLEGRFDEARALFENAAPLRVAAGGPGLGPAELEFLEKLEAEGAPLPAGIDIDGEIEELVAEVSLVTRGYGLYRRALRQLRADTDEARTLAGEDLARAVDNLRRAGARHLLHLALNEVADLDERAGRTEAAKQQRREGSEVWRGAAVSPDASPAVSANALRLASAVLDLGQLDALTPRAGAMWGELAARLCRDFGAERCAMVEVGPEGLSLLTARGGTPWHEQLLTHLRENAPSAPWFGPALPDPTSPGGTGQLAIVPFSAARLSRRGYIALENRLAAPWFGPLDAALLEALGRQVGILLQNVATWQELSSARQRLEQENRYYREASPGAPVAGGRLLAGGAAMRATLDLIARVAPTDTPVLVTGETGVGKELVSREIHEQSRRRDGPFIVVHVAALAPGLVASALFGHERGAFTGATERVKGRFELADEGTLFLDEVGELQPEDQVRLLRVLQEGTFERVGGTRELRSDFRLIAATNRDLAREVASGRFREDLYFRLAAFPIRVPPLRERREEIPMLALCFMEREGRKRGVRFDGIAASDMDRLVAYPWPGNVRELEHVLERAAVLSDPPRLRIPGLDAPSGPAQALAAAAVSSASEPEEWVTMEEAERRYLRKVLRHVGGRVTGSGGAAELLGMNPSTVQFRIGKLGLRDEVAEMRASRPKARS